MATTDNRKRAFTVLSASDKSVGERKRALRAYMKERRALVDNKDVKEALMIQGVFDALKQAGKADATHIFVYLSFSGEARTDGLIDALLCAGKQVYAPRVDGGCMFPVQLGEDFTLSEFGIREPVGEAYAGKMDVAIVPLLAVDGQGNRLGYGGGYYDRYLRDNPSVFRIGFCYEIQRLDKVPVHDGDETLHAVVTDKQVSFF